jgi:hypothetical protein
VLQNDSGNLTTAQPPQLKDFKQLDNFLAVLALYSETEPKLYFLTLLCLPYAHPYQISGITKQKSKLEL